MYASICRRIGGRWCCADCLKSPHGAGLHDYSATTSFHCLRGGLRHEKLSLQDGSQETVVVFLGMDQERFWSEDTGIVKKQVHAAELPGCGLDDGARNGGLRDVSGYIRHQLAFWINGSRRRPQNILSASVENDPRSLANKCFSDGLSDTRPAASHDRHFSLESQSSSLVPASCHCDLYLPTSR